MLWNWSDLGIKLSTTTFNSEALRTLLEFLNPQNITCTMGMKTNLSMGYFKNKMRNDCNILCLTPDLVNIFKMG